MGKDTGTKAHFLVVCRQFLLILWKNFLLQVRTIIMHVLQVSSAMHWVVTACRIRITCTTRTCTRAVFLPRASSGRVVRELNTCVAQRDAWVHLLTRPASPLASNQVETPQSFMQLLLQACIIIDLIWDRVWLLASFR